MGIYAHSETITYLAWNVSTNLPVTGDSANHTLYWIKDGTLAAVTNAPAEVSGAVFPGAYKIVLTAAEMTCWQGKLGGKSSTSNVQIMPEGVSNVYLPTAAPNAAGGLLITAAGSLNADAMATRVALALPASAPGAANGLALYGAAGEVTLPDPLYVTIKPGTFGVAALAPRTVVDVGEL